MTALRSERRPPGQIIVPCEHCGHPMIRVTMPATHDRPGIRVFHCLRCGLQGRPEIMPMGEPEEAAA